MSRDYGRFMFASLYLGRTSSVGALQGLTRHVKCGACHKTQMVTCIPLLGGRNLRQADRVAPCGAQQGA